MIGPRNMRRLAIAAGITAVVIAAVTVVLLTRPTARSGRAASAPRSQCVRHPDGTCTVNLFSGIIPGMSPQQVQRRLGKPATKQGRCWLYPQQRDKYLASHGVVKSVRAACFFAGRLSDTKEQDYIRRHGKLVLWHPPFGPGN